MGNFQQAVWPHSGHYKPTPENFQDFVSFLKGNHVDLADVKVKLVLIFYRLQFNSRGEVKYQKLIEITFMHNQMDPADEEEEESLSKQSSVFLRSISSEEDLSEKTNSETEQLDGEDKSSEKTNSAEEEEDPASEQPSQLLPPGSLRGNLPSLLIPDKDDLFEKLKLENQALESSADVLGAKFTLDGYETSEDQTVSEQYLSDEEDEETKESIPEESILKRIDSHKRLNSFQLGKQLSCKWTTGAGPRIGCLRDYPSELQFHALEQVNLSPRSAGHFRSNSTRESIPNSFSGEIRIRKTSFSGELPQIRHYTPQSSPLCKGASTAAKRP